MAGNPRRRRPPGRGSSAGRGKPQTPRVDLSADSVCSQCEKATSLCACGGITPQKNRVSVVVLQHPQEPDKLLGTAKLLTISLENSKLHVGLSVPNLKRILGPDADTENLDPKRWGVLYLGSGMKSQNSAPLKPGIYFTTKDGALLPESEQHELRRNLEGFILLDGTWSQAKALWWRNPWLLKLRRMILVPAEKSSYRELRKEPRGECLSTLETAAETLTALGEPSAIEQELKATFRRLLGQYRTLLKSSRTKTERGRSDQCEAYSQTSDESSDPESSE